MGDFLRFETMLAPLLIQILFWVMAAGCVANGIMLIIRGADGDVHSGLALIVLGPLAVRIYSEILIVSSGL